MSPYQIPIQIALDDMQARIEARRKNLPAVPVLAKAEVINGNGIAQEKHQSTRHPDRRNATDSCGGGQTNLNGIGESKPAEVSSEDTRPRVGSVSMPPAAQDQFTPAKFRARIQRQAMGI